MSDSIVKTSRTIYVVGSVCTLGYLGLIVWYVFLKWPLLQTMEPNSTGDFLAGVFSPLAFTWLVLGFVQQGVELRQNSAALHLQAEELRSAAEHAGAMVELQRKEFEIRIQELERSRIKAEEANQAAAERRARESQRREEEAVRQIQPSFYFEHAFRHGKNGHVVGMLHNDGHECSAVEVVMSSIPGVLALSGCTTFDMFAAKLRQPISFISEDGSPRTHSLSIQYADARGVRREAGFIVSVSDLYLQFSAKDDEL